MKKDEKLKMILREIERNFNKEQYEDSLLKLEEAGKLIIASLNAYNKKH